MRQHKMASFLRRSSGRRYFSIAFLTLCTLTIFWASLNAHRSTNELLTTAEVATAPIWPLSSAVEHFEKDHRVIFPYSIIPGGAESQQELRQAVTKDPVVARHYSDFDLARVRRITLSAPQSMYVSYRIGNDVFWTKTQIDAAEGRDAVDGWASNGPNSLRKSGFRSSKQTPRSCRADGRR